MTALPIGIGRTLAAGLVSIAALSAPVYGYAAEAATSQAALVKALANSKLTLADGIRQATKNGGAAISAKFEFDDAGKLSLSVYTADKGLAVAAEENVLEELSGSPEAASWKPETEVFKDVPHVSRAATQLTLMSMSRASLPELIHKAQQQAKGIVLSATPEIRKGKPAVVIQMVNAGKLTELQYPL